VPVPDWVEAIGDAWIDAAELQTGKLFRCVCRGGKRWGDGITERLVWHVVKRTLPSWASGRLRCLHDLRFMREVVPCCGRGVGADSISSRPRVSPNHQAFSPL
jgi:hypothetical protein